jgi:hypothetical protein
MACDHYEKRLTDLALDLLDEKEAAVMRAHVAECAACRAAFERERALFAAVDAGLDAAVNATPSPEFVARIRQRVAAEAETARGTSWLSGWIPVTVAGVAAVALLAVWLVPQLMETPAQPPQETAQTQPPATPSTPPVATPAPTETGPQVAAAAPPRVEAPRTPRRRAPVEAAPAVQPEIIVPAGQMDAIRAFYRAALSPRVEAEALLAAAGPLEPLPPLSVTRLEVPGLQVKRLGATEPDSDTK